jgi:trans-2,3-dihydro-3-hydroxyanthranilate isomerase
MQQIAQEMHFSETTFIAAETPRRGGYDVRIFTPDSELPFAGHPTLGTAYIIQSEMIGKPVPTVKLNLEVGQIPVTFSYRKGEADLLWMRQNEPTFGATYKPARVARALGLKLSDFDARFPIMDVSTGIPFVITPLKDLRAVRGVQAGSESLRDFVGRIKSSGVLVFSSETYEKGNDLNARVLVPSVAIPEDPATGSANGCLAAYLISQKYFGEERVAVRVEQGYEVGRKSLLLLKAEKRGRTIEVNVGGRVQFIASGEFPS